MMATVAMTAAWNRCNGKTEGTMVQGVRVTDEPRGGRASSASRLPRWRAVLAAARPRQWMKNLLVFAAPTAALVVGRPVTFGRTAAAAILFCVASSGVYFINDVVDAEADRHHPVKRFRPVASSQIAPRSASALGATLLAVATLGAFLVGGAALGVVIVAYGLISLAYSLKLKSVPVVELLCISAGFVLRTVAGGAAARIPISPWFLVVACSGSLLVACGKRTAELMALGEECPPSSLPRVVPEALSHGGAAGLGRHHGWRLLLVGRHPLLHPGRSCPRRAVHPAVDHPLRRSGPRPRSKRSERAAGRLPEDLALKSRGLQAAGAVAVTWSSSPSRRDVLRTEAPLGVGPQPELARGRRAAHRRWRGSSR